MRTQKSVRCGVRHVFPLPRRLAQAYFEPARGFEPCCERELVGARCSMTEHTRYKFRFVSLVCRRSEMAVGGVKGQDLAITILRIRIRNRIVGVGTKSSQVPEEAIQDVECRGSELESSRAVLVGRSKGTRTKGRKSSEQNGLFVVVLIGAVRCVSERKQTAEVARGIPREGGCSGSSRVPPAGNFEKKNVAVGELEWGWVREGVS